jgi:hypothetical protein
MHITRQEEIETQTAAEVRSVYRFQTMFARLQHTSQSHKL